MKLSILFRQPYMRGKTASQVNGFTNNAKI